MEFCVKLLSKDKEKVIYPQTEPLSNGDFFMMNTGILPVR